MSSCRGAAALALALALGLPSRAAPPKDTPVGVLKGVQVTRAADGVAVRIDLTHPREAARNQVDSPFRVFFDFPDTRLSESLPREIPVGHKLLDKVRLGQYTSEPAVARVVLDLPSAQPLKVSALDGGKTLLIQLGQGADVPSAPPPPQPKLQVTGGTWSRQGSTDSTFVLALSDSASHQALYLTDPDRVVLDVDGAELKADAQAPSTANGVVASVRASQFQPDVVRFVFELRCPAGFLVFRRLAPPRIEIRLAQGQVKGRTVVVDAGHGGKDPGCLGVLPNLHEANVTLDISRRVQKLLEARQVRCVMTREDDSYVPLYDRPAFANQLHADLFVSIHCNCMPAQKRGTISGTELYYFHQHSRFFAELMLREFCRATGQDPRGVRQRRFVVVRETAMPAVLVETGYLDSPKDGNLLNTPDFRQRCALGITEGVTSFLKRMPAAEPAAPEPTPTADRPRLGPQPPGGSGA